MSIGKWFLAPRAAALAVVLVMFGAVGAASAQTRAYGAFAYVPDIAGQVHAIDTATNTVVATIPAVGSFPIAVTIVVMPPPSAPTTREQCKNGGWQVFTNPSFRNQGECISYVNHL